MSHHTSIERMLELLLKMARIRTFEETIERLNREGRIPGFLHTSIGQEASAVGTCEVLQEGDYVTSTHRGHGHCLAKGADLRATMCELYGKAGGQNGGRGGSMHVSDFGVNMLGANAIVGAGLGIAVGAALSSKFRESGNIAVAFFGEGASSNGAFHENLNLASSMGVPVLFVCENNGYAHEAPVQKMLNVPNVADFHTGYGIPGEIVDGNDVLAVLDVMTEVTDVVRSTGRPALVEAKTYRHRGHHGGDSGRHYRPAEEIEAWLAKDPILRLSRRLAEAGVDQGTIDGVLADAQAEIDDAVEFAEAAPLPDPESALLEVYGGDSGE
ncbi:MAG: thiamine pyrophosphate-dependent dehydrogenase E1 component subunit alpha [bacterium]|nr:thiamine pyrophosphate-dependent dehydrogenase E1 component subunit alpha [bacterium]